MKFWNEGQQFDTETMNTTDKIRLLKAVEADLKAANDAITELSKCSDLREFALRHFGNDGIASLYTDRVEVANRLEWKLTDLWGSERVVALRAMGFEPHITNPEENEPVAHQPSKPVHTTKGLQSTLWAILKGDYSKLPNPEENEPVAHQPSNRAKHNG